MNIARIKVGSEPAYAVVEGDTCRLIEGDLFGSWKPGKKTVALADAELVAPVDAPQIVAIGLNYKRHAEESKMALPVAPVVFFKTINCITGPNAPIRLPKIAPDEVDYEGELVIVIGKKAKNVAKKDAADYILGYTCGNDVSARDCQLRLDKQWARGKSFDTFAPIGPWIATDVDGDNLRLRLVLNDKVMQDTNTADLIFPCAELVSYLSQCMTLYPGSIIMTGTPSGVGFSQKPPAFLREGDRVTVEIEGIGSLTNPVEMEV